MVLTSIAYMPGYGIASAGTTLVGQSIGAGDRGWGMRVGTRVILLTALYMGGIGVLLALAGPLLLPLFTYSRDAQAMAAIALGTRLLWLAAGYHFLTQWGWGDIGGWSALVLYVLLLGTTLFLRWRSGAWQRIRL
jgi:MATE family multidrug resistance protein